MVIALWLLYFIGAVFLLRWCWQQHKPPFHNNYDRDRSTLVMVLMMAALCTFGLAMVTYFVLWMLFVFVGCGAVVWAFWRYVLPWIEGDQ